MKDLPHYSCHTTHLNPPFSNHLLGFKNCVFVIPSFSSIAQKQQASIESYLWNDLPLVPLCMFVHVFIFSYSDIIIEREVLMQKYIHLVQIVETEKVAANQLRTQLEDQDTEIERLKAEVWQYIHTQK